MQNLQLKSSTHHLDQCTLVLVFDIVGFLYNIGFLKAFKIITALFQIKYVSFPLRFFSLANISEVSLLYHCFGIAGPRAGSSPHWQSCCWDTTLFWVCPSDMPIPEEELQELIEGWRALFPSISYFLTN